MNNSGDLQASAGAGIGALMVLRTRIESHQ
jgi:hypothetical protein